MTWPSSSSTAPRSMRVGFFCWSPNCHVAWSPFCSSPASALRACNIGTTTRRSKSGGISMRAESPDASTKFFVCAHSGFEMRSFSKETAGGHPRCTRIPSICTSRCRRLATCFSSQRSPHCDCTTRMSAPIATIGTRTMTATRVRSARLWIMRVGKPGPCQVPGSSASAAPPIPRRCGASSVRFAPVGDSGGRSATKRVGRIRTPRPPFVGRRRRSHVGAARA